ncbi:MAG TPA: zinc ribbon domain-containing protein [Sumerlaeia bacterium]|nr:zinc ribbon domain-containing protein [Sumerlaeia bacterium]
MAKEVLFAMPVYEFSCRKCSKSFTLKLSLADYESKKARCPKCSSARVVRRISAFSVKTSKKS